MAKPSTMAMTGLGMSRISDWKSTSAEPWYSTVLRSSLWSRPDEKAFGPDPEMTTTRTPSSSSASWRATDISSVVLPRVALYTSGRLIVNQAMPSDFS